VTYAADTLPTAIYGAKQVRAFDRLAIESEGIEGYELMCRAGQAAYDVVRREWPQATRLGIYCGAGNNAGDGYVLARLAGAAGLEPIVTAVTDPGSLTGDAALAWQAYRQAGGSALTLEETQPANSADLIVDALLGTGLTRALDGAYARAVNTINGSGRPVLALDIPTGLAADSGTVQGCAVVATVTLSFVGLKLGLYLGVAPDYCGRIEFSDLAIPATVLARGDAALTRLTPNLLGELLPPRRRTAHKGTHGRLLLVGGGPGMPGAIRLAAEAALRVGAGLVYVATHPDNVAAIPAGRPEIICRGVAAASELAMLEAQADAIVLGPGLGRSDWSADLARHLFRSRLPLIVDADGLNLLSGQRVGRNNWILTPHPGEAARLLGTSVGAIEHDRLGSARELARAFNTIAVLKGAHTLVASAATTECPSVCDRGNPGMATAGMGDVLSGVIGGLYVQTRLLESSAQAGVVIHALAGDAAAAAGGERGLLASDLMPFLRRWANPRS
jgi:hydroxyethylthiazole kinase-like uncharacterized protein yjeF